MKKEVKIKIIGNAANDKIVIIPLKRRELIELMVNVETFVKEYEDFFDDDYKNFLKQLHKKLEKAYSLFNSGV